MDDKTTHELSAEQLKKLLGICEEGAPRKRDDSGMEIIHTLQRLLEQPSRLVGGRAPGQVLLDPKADASHVLVVKEQAKRLARGKCSPDELASLNAIYYAAIASALVFHHEKITRHTYQTLKTSFGKLMERPWMPAELVKLFAQARKRCNE